MVATAVVAVVADTALVETIVGATVVVLGRAVVGAVVAGAVEPPPQAASDTQTVTRVGPTSVKGRIVILPVDGVFHEEYCAVSHGEATMTTIDTWDTPFLQGLLAPVADERDDRDLKVIGEIPAALRGMFVRTGPNPQFAPMGAYHPFDGDGMLHAVYLEDGKARYRNRYIESDRKSTRLNSSH